MPAARTPHTAVAELHHPGNETETAVSFGAEALALHQRSGHRLNEARARTVLGHKDSAHRAAALEIFTELGAPEAANVRVLLDGEAGR